MVYFVLFQHLSSAVIVLKPKLQKSVDSDLDCSLSSSLSLKSWFAIHCLLALVNYLRPSQHFFSHVRMFSWAEPLLNSENKVTCFGTLNSASSGLEPGTSLFLPLSQCNPHSHLLHAADDIMN